MSYHRERKLAGVGAIDAATRPTRSAPAPSFSNPAWAYYTGRAGLGRMMEERPTRPPPQGGGSGRVDSAPAPQTGKGIYNNPTPPIYVPQNTGTVPPVLQWPPYGSPPTQPPTPLPPPVPPPIPGPTPLPPPPPPQPSCAYPFAIVNGQCVLVGGVVPPVSSGGTKPIDQGTGGSGPIFNPFPLPPVETDEYTVDPPAPAAAPKKSIVPLLLIGGGVALGLALVLRKR